ncbi:hypothetical protein KFE25_009844 [Diacronema lutheri]|uniref:Uncharacterized protein n=1 Tax=Diacronema lutheri TaxID=2081491 RepID=A0A8J5X4E5_DIALT|nr:hypothetical protein KFE25_009844 [Diacronema lutheri]
MVGTPRHVAPSRARVTQRTPRSLAVAKEGGNDDREDTQWTAKQLMREEIESPFRKPRQTIAAFSAFSASVALLVSGSRSASCVLGGVCVQPLAELLPNVAIDAGVIAFAAVSLWTDSRAQASKLRRIARGAELANLQLSAVSSSGGTGAEGAAEGVPTRANVAVKDFRKARRVVIVAGGASVYERVIASASSHAAELRDGEIVVVPVLLREGAPADKLVEPSGCTGGVDAAAAPWGDAAGVFYTPRGPESWGRWLAAEVQTAVSQGFDVHGSGITIAVKKSGKVGKRSTSVPSWPALVGMLRLADANFGMPQF